MKTYSIAAAELKKIIELVNTGYQCTEFSDDETLYIRLEKDKKTNEFEFVQCYFYKYLIEHYRYKGVHAMGFLLFYIKTFTLQYRTESTEERRV